MVSFNRLEEITGDLAEIKLLVSFLVLFNSLIKKRVALKITIVLQLLRLGGSCGMRSSCALFYWQKTPEEFSMRGVGRIDFFLSRKSDERKRGSRPVRVDPVSRTCSELIYGSLFAANVCLRDVASFVGKCCGNIGRQ
jgi:hypothetical protein